MKRKRLPTPQPRTGALPASRWSERALAFTTLAGLVVIPLIVVPGGLDSFRWPKEIAFRGLAILLVIIGAWLPLSRFAPLSLHHLKRPDVALPAIILVWALVTAATAINRPLAWDSVITVAAAIVIFAAARMTFAHLGLRVVDVVMVPAVINAVFVFLQEYGFWQPFQMPPEAQGHQASTALIGNPNDVGTFLLFPAGAAAAMVVSQSGKRRWIYCLVMAVLVLGLIASGTRTAIAAFVVALACVALLQKPRALALLVVLVIGGSIAFHMRHRFVPLWEAVQSKQYDIAFSERLPGFLSAVEMARDHPLVGVGPGGFKFQFMPYRLSIQDRYPAHWVKGWPQIFGETHNDYLQILAETGFPGLLLFLSAIGILMVRCFTRADEDSAMVFARALCLALGAATAVVCLFQFPLQLAAPRLVLLTLAAGFDVRRGGYVV